MRGAQIRKTGMKILRSLQNIINILISSINIYFTTGAIRTSRSISVLFDKKVFSFGFIGTPLNAWLRGNMIEAHFTLTKRQTSIEKRTKPPSSPIYQLDCKTVHIFAYSSTREQSNKRSGTRLKTERRLGRDARFFFLSPHSPYGLVRLGRFARTRLLRHASLISLLILRKKTDCFAVYLPTRRWITHLSAGFL